MLTIKRAYELLAPFKENGDWQIVRVDIANANIAVQPDNPVDERIAQTVETLIELAAKVWGVTPQNITSHGRPMMYVWPRMAVCKALLEIVGLSDNGTAKFINRCRTGVSYLRNQANTTLTIDREFKRLYEKFEGLVKEHVYKCRNDEIEWQSGEH